MPVRVAAGLSDRRNLVVDADGSTSIVVGQSYEPVWSASVDGDDLGAPIALDTMTGWIVDRDDRVILTASVSAQPLYIASLVGSASGLVLCGVLVMWPGRRRR